ncbi:hypothetical protein HPB49_013822 [Dermacentor silvarum]|uniref:Uncharacterized protein n=1 Tax=Dermacentor silvarum TaxID=543639 RepID=A0ACB8DDE3_DERSI|nr:hypothetical protein HPB49_013822 [Dermacentor silvarum]
MFAEVIREEKKRKYSMGSQIKQKPRDATIRAVLWRTAPKKEGHVEKLGDFLGIAESLVPTLHGIMNAHSPAHAGELDAGPNRNEEADTEAHALTSRGSPSTHSSEPQRPDAEDEEYSITTYGDVLQWYRTSRRLYPPPHRDLQRSEAATLRQLQVQAIWTPVWAKHVCPEVYTTDICQHCKKARATQRHLLWDCAPPPDNQEAMPTVISSKIISREPGNQRDVVRARA